MKRALILNIHNGEINEKGFNTPHPRSVLCIHWLLMNPPHKVPGMLTIDDLFVVSLNKLVNKHNG